MSKTTPEEACRLAEKHDVWMYNSNWKALAALIDEARGVDAEPVGFRVRHMYPQGPGPWRFLDKGIAHAQEGEELQLLYTHPAPSQPAAPVELPIVAVISSYAIPVSDKRYADEILIQRSRQIEGPALWAVRLNGDCLNKSGEWEWEPMPSSRDDEFLDRCRFSTAQEAIDAAIAAGRKAS